MDFKEIAVWCWLVGAWPSLEIWIDGVFRVFTFVTPTLKILGKKGKKAGLNISHFCLTSCTVAHTLFSKKKLWNCSVMGSYVFVLTALYRMYEILSVPKMMWRGQKGNERMVSDVQVTERWDASKIGSNKRRWTD